VEGKVNLHHPQVTVCNIDFFCGGVGRWEGGGIFFSHNVYKVNGQEKGDTVPGVTTLRIFSRCWSVFGLCSL
jgi:hypothetical protein